MIKMQAAYINFYSSFSQAWIMNWFSSFYVRFPATYQSPTNTETRNKKRQNFVHRIFKYCWRSFLVFWLFSSKPYVRILIYQNTMV